MKKIRLFASILFACIFLLEIQHFIPKLFSQPSEQNNNNFLYAQSMQDMFYGNYMIGNLSKDSIVNKEADSTKIFLSKTMKHYCAITINDGYIAIPYEEDFVRVDIKSKEKNIIKMMLQNSPDSIYIESPNDIIYLNFDIVNKKEKTVGQLNIELYGYDITTDSMYDSYSLFGSVYIKYKETEYRGTTSIKLHSFLQNITSGLPIDNSMPIYFEMRLRIVHSSKA